MQLRVTQMRWTEHVGITGLGDKKNMQDFIQGQEGKTSLLKPRRK